MCKFCKELIGIVKYCPVCGKDLTEYIRRVLTWNGSKGWSVNPVDSLGSNPSSELILTYLDYE